jgi:putative membrane protein insertion efficiency factor
MDSGIGCRHAPAGRSCGRGASRAATACRPDLASARPGHVRGAAAVGVPGHPRADHDNLGPRELHRTTPDRVRRRARSRSGRRAESHPTTAASDHRRILRPPSSRGLPHSCRAGRSGPVLWRAERNRVHRPSSPPHRARMTTEAKPRASWAQRGLRAGINVYRTVRAGRPSPCRFVPSCSSYALEAIENHGAWRGVRLSARRVARCHPWGGFGIDPVPPKRTV